MIWGIERARRDSAVAPSIYVVPLPPDQGMGLMCMYVKGSGLLDFVWAWFDAYAIEEALADEACVVSKTEPFRLVLFVLNIVYSKETKCRHNWSCRAVPIRSMNQKLAMVTRPTLSIAILTALTNSTGCLQTPLKLCNPPNMSSVVLFAILTMENLSIASAPAENPQSSPRILDSHFLRFVTPAFYGYNPVKDKSSNLRVIKLIWLDAVLWRTDFVSWRGVEGSEFCTYWRLKNSSTEPRGGSWSFFGQPIVCRLLTQIRYIFFSVLAATSWQPRDDGSFKSIEKSTLINRRVIVVDIVH